VKKQLKDETAAILSFIEKHGVVNKDDSLSKNKSTQKHICRKHSVRVVLDLHGMKSDDAARRVRSFFAHNREMGIREILVIHGRGNHSSLSDGPVLKKLVREMLESELAGIVKDFKTAVPRDGGDGATLVYLR
jgi:DNA-nicking Smr family endonuclease